MSSLAFLIDANMTSSVADAVFKLEPSIEIHCVGDGASPPVETLDSDLLIYCEVNVLALVTFDKKTMPSHLADHYRVSSHTHGVMIFKDDRLAPGRIADEIFMVWACTSAEEWVDYVEYFPL